MYDLFNQSVSMDESIIKKMLDTLVPWSQQNLKFDRPVSIVLIDDDENSSNPLGKTAYYSPNNDQIVIYVTGRHTKDILRSISHELVHHAQNCRGEFSEWLAGERDVGEDYAQSDQFLREMEREAYEKGNLIFRDWEDNKKKKDSLRNLDENTLSLKYENLKNKLLK